MFARLINLSRWIDSLNDRIGSAVGWAVPLAVLAAAIYAVARTFVSDTQVAWLDSLFNQRSNAWFEIQWYLFAAIVLMTASTTLRRHEHVRVDVLVERFSHRVRAWVDLFGIVLFLLPLCGIMLWYGVPYAALSIQSQEVNNAGGLPTWPAKAIIVLGFAALGLQAVSECIKRAAYLAGRLDATIFERAAPPGPTRDPAGQRNPATGGVERS